MRAAIIVTLEFAMDRPVWARRFQLVTTRTGTKQSPLVYILIGYLSTECSPAGASSTP